MGQSHAWCRGLEDASDMPIPDACAPVREERDMLDGSNWIPHICYCCLHGGTGKEQGWKVTAESLECDTCWNPCQSTVGSPPNASCAWEVGSGQSITRKREPSQESLFPGNTHVEHMCQ